MTKKGSIPHEKCVQLELTAHKMQGHRVINLGGKSPDGIVIDWENRKIIAVDAISGDTKKWGARMNYHQKLKVDLYGGLGFDSVEVPLYFKDGSQNLRIKHIREHP